MYSNDIRVANTATPSMTTKVNVGGFGWTGAEQGHYNQLIQYVDECRQIWKDISEKLIYVNKVIEKIKEFENLADHVDSQAKIVAATAEAVKDMLVIVETDYSQISNMHLDFSKKFAVFSNHYVDFLEKYDETLLAAASAEVSKQGAKEWYDKSYDIYLDLKQGQVYRGTWNPNTGSYPDAQGTNSVWDVILNSNQSTVDFGGFSWKSGDRLVYVLSETKYDQLSTGSGVFSVNGKTGFVELVPSDIGALAVGGTAVAANKLATPRKISGVDFDGTKDINLRYSDVGAESQGAVTFHEEKENAHPISGVAGLQAALDAKVPTSRKVNNKALTDDISLTAADVGALALTGGIATGTITVKQQASSDGIGVENADAPATFHMRFLNNIATLRYGGTGVGSASGMQVAGVGDSVKFKIDNAGELYAKGTSKVYHQEFKPTAADVGALSLTGGTLTGALSTNLNDAAPLVLDRKQQVGIRFNHSTSGIRYVGVDSEGNLRFGGSNNHGTNFKVFHEGYMPPVDALGALPLTGGTLTGNLTVARTDTTEAQIGIRRDGRHTYMYDSGSASGIYSSGFSGKPNVVLIGRAVSDGSINIGSSEVPLVLRGTSPLKFNSESVYHTGFKPGAGDVGAYTKAEVDNLFSSSAGMVTHTVNAPSGVEAGKYYPILVTGSIHNSEVYISTRSSGGNDPMNNCSFTGHVRAAGWSDQFSRVVGSFTAYASEERAIHSIYVPSENAGGYAIYVEGRAFPVVVRVTSGISVSCTGANMSFGSSVFNAGVSSPAGTKINVGADFSKGTGFYYGSNLMYHQGFKPTAADVGALPLSGGGTVTGNVGVTGNFSTTGSITVGTTLDVKTSNLRVEGVDIVGANSSIVRLGDGSYARPMNLNAKDYNLSVVHAGVAKRIYHEGFPPPASPDSLPLDGGGTVKGSINLSDGTNYVYYRVSRTNGSTAQVGEFTLSSGNAQITFNDGGSNAQGLVMKTGGTVPYYRYGSTDYPIYSTKNKPTISEIGAASGGYALGLPNGTDINVTLRAHSGFFNASGATNRPSWPVSGAHTWDYYFNAAHSNSAGYNGVIAMDFNGTGLAFKAVSNGTAYSWKYVYHTGFKPTAADVGAVSKSGDTMTGDLTMGAQKVVGTSGGYYLNLMGGNSSPTLASSASVIIHGDSDGSGTAEFVSLRAGAGTANELKILSKTSSAGVNNSALTFNGNVVYHAGNKPTASDVGAQTGYGNYNFGGNQNQITTTQFLDLLVSIGAFTGRGWAARGGWTYAANQIINDTGFGNIHLAGSWVEVMGGSRDSCTIRITTATTTSGGTANATYVYVNNGSSYSPGWRRDYNTRFKPTAADVGLGNVPNTVHTAADTANTVAVRDGSGDIHARLMRLTYANESNIPSSGGILFRNNNSNDNYTRVCNNPASLLNWLQIAHNTATLSSTGWWKCGKTKLMIQWGKRGSGGPGFAAVTFPVAFTVGAYAGFSTYYKSSAVGDYRGVHSLTSTGMQVSADNCETFWFVIGQ